MNKKTIIKYIVGAVVLYVAYSFFFGAKAEAQEVAKTWEVQSEVGKYEKRIDTGAYTGDDAAYVKLSTDLGVIGGLSLVGDLEYVNTDDYQVYATVGTELNTFIGVLGVYGEYSTVEAGDGLFEGRRFLLLAKVHLYALPRALQIAHKSVEGSAISRHSVAGGGRQSVELHPGPKCRRRRPSERPSVEPSGGRPPTGPSNDPVSRAARWTSCTN